MLFTPSYPSIKPSVYSSPLVPALYYPRGVGGTPPEAGLYAVGFITANAFTVFKSDETDWNPIVGDDLNNVYTTSIGLFSPGQSSGSYWDYTSFKLQQAKGGGYYPTIVDPSDIQPPPPDGACYMINSNSPTLAYRDAGSWAEIQNANSGVSFTFEDSYGNTFNTTKVGLGLSAYLASYKQGVVYNYLTDPRDIPNPAPGMVALINQDQPQVYLYMNEQWGAINFQMVSANNMTRAIYEGHPYIGDTPNPPQTDYQFAVYPDSLAIRSPAGRYYPDITDPQSIPAPTQSMDYLVMISNAQMYYWAKPSEVDSPTYLPIQGALNDDPTMGPVDSTFLDLHTGLQYTIIYGILPFVYQVCGTVVDTLPPTTPTTKKRYVLYENQPMYLNTDTSAWEPIPVFNRSIFKSPGATYLITINALGEYSKTLINPPAEFTDALLYKYIKRNFTSGSQNINLYEDSADVQQINLTDDNNDPEFVIQSNLGVPVVILDSTVVAIYPNNLQVTEQPNGDLTIDAGSLAVGDTRYANIEYWVSGRKYTRSYIVNKLNSNSEGYNLTATLDSDAQLSDTFGRDEAQPLVYNDGVFDYHWGVTGAGSQDFNDGVFTVPKDGIYKMMVDVPYNIPQSVASNSNLGEIILTVNDDPTAAEIRATFTQLDINYPTVVGEYPLKSGSMKVDALLELYQGDEISLYYQSNNFDTPVELSKLESLTTWNIQIV